MHSVRRLGSYELLNQLAVGGMAEIYVARSKGVQGFEKEYVLKLIHPKYVGDAEFIRMLVDEAKLVGGLTHPNVAQVIDLCVDGDSYFILMEYVRGKDLYQVLNHAWELGYNLPIPMCVQITADICSGLYYAHHKCDASGRPLNVVHRDISPQNIIVSYNGEAKIVDFGVAKAALGARPETRAGIIKGKFRYMSPEQAWGEKLDGRSDLFSAGLCLYEMVCGETAYTDDGDMQKMLAKMRQAEFTRPSQYRPEVDAELEHIILRALSRDRNERYPTCHAFEVALARYLHTHFPGYTRLDISAVMKEMYPEDTHHLHLPEPTEQTSGVDGIDVGTDELEAMGFVLIDDSGTQDETVQGSYAEMLEAARTQQQPEEAMLTRDQNDYYDDVDDPTIVDIGLEARKARAEAAEILNADATQETIDLEGFTNKQAPRQQRPVRPTGPPMAASPQRPPPVSRDDRPPTSYRETRRPPPPRDTVAYYIERYMPPAIAAPALRSHRRLAELLDSDGGSNVLMLVLGVTLGLFLLLLIVLIVF